MQKHGLIVWLLLLACFTQLAGQDQYTQISLSEARALALAQNPEYQSAVSALNAAKWGQSNAFSAMLPSLSLTGTLLYMDPATTVGMGASAVQLNKDQRSMALNLSQPLFVGGKLYQAHKLSGVSYELAELNLSAASLTMISAVEGKYYSVLQLQNVHEIARAEQEQAIQNLELALLKQQNGLISRADYLRFQASKNNKDLALLQAETALQLALKDFNNFLGTEYLMMPSALSLEGVDTERYSELDSAGIQAFSKKAVQEATKGNLSLKTVHKSLELSERAYKMAKGSFLPTLMLTGSRQYRENGSDRYEWDASNQIMLNLSLPLLPQVGNYAAARKAFYEAERQEYQAQSATDGIALSVESAAINLVSSARQVHSAKLSLEISQDIYDQLSERFRLNMLSAMELMDAELMLSAARMAYNNTYYNFFKARLSLLTALGTDDYAELNALLQD